MELIDRLELVCCPDSSECQQMAAYYAQAGGPAALASADHLARCHLRERHYPLPPVDVEQVSADTAPMEPDQDGGTLRFQPAREGDPGVHVGVLDRSGGRRQPVADQLIRLLPELRLDGRTAEGVHRRALDLLRLGGQPAEPQQAEDDHPSQLALSWGSGAPLG
jgi:hypothetical protein